jgi:hypothetical protein
MSFFSDALGMAGAFTEPVVRTELEPLLATERRRAALLAAHLDRVLAAAPASAAPHRAALEAQQARILWLERRLEEERVLDAWRRDNPPTAGRELRAILHYLGLGPNPFPVVPPAAPAPEAKAAKPRAA